MGGPHGCSWHNDVIAETRELRFPYAGHVEQILHDLEPADLISVVAESLKQHRTHPGQPLHLGSGCMVDAKQTAFGGGGRNGGACCRDHDLLTVRDG